MQLSLSRSGTERPLNLLFVIKSMSTPGGGAERVLADVTSELANRGHRLTIVSFDAAGSTDFYPIDARIERIRLEIGNASNKTRMTEVVRRIFSLRQLTSALGPDVAIGFMHSSYLPLAIALVGSDVPVIASEHVDFTHYRALPIDGLAIRAVSIVPTFMTITSERVRSGFPAALRRRMVVIPNPVVSPIGRRADPVGGRKKVLLSVGRLFDEKDHRTLIAAFGRLASRHPEWLLRIVGEGMLRASLERQIDELGLDSQIEMPGIISAISTEYRKAQLFVLPSKYESFGLATAEALAHGLPAVGFADCAGTNELIQHNVNGLLANGSDREAALFEALDTLMGSDELRGKLGAAGPPSIQRFSITAVTDRWETLLYEANERNAHIG